MQFSLSFAALAACVGLAIATPTPEVNILSDAEFVEWLKTTDANLTFIGDPIPGYNAPEGLVSRAAQATWVSYCSKRIGNICGGDCTVYNGGPRCLNAPDTVCLAANHDVGFCDRAGCGHSCNSYNSCGTRLDGGYCYTPGTKSILQLARMEFANAEAGPSSPREVQPEPRLHLWPPRPSPPVYLRSTDDLLSRFQLYPAYDKWVRPYVTPLDPNDPNAPPPAAGASDTKGKARDDMMEVDGPIPPPPSGATPLSDSSKRDGADEAGKEEKKRKNNYRHLIKGLPGKHSTKGHDDYYERLIMQEQKPRVRIRQFDLRKHEEAFSVSPQGIPGYNAHALIQESAQAREDRKRAKQLRKLQHAHGSQPPPPTQVPTPASTQHAGTPRPGLQSRPSVAKLPPPVNTRVGTPRAGTPLRSAVSAATPAPMSAHPPGRTPAQQAGGHPPPRGLKRERDDAPPTPVTANGHTTPQANGGGGPMKGSGRAGVPGARPRPVKKQRVDSQGIARDASAPIQQPTPQGV
ncbi:hypothetical protein HDZ31DRAFT_80688 [Schizophyllum fasciatum]